MESDHGGLFGCVEVAGDGIADHRFEFIESVGLREDGKTKRASLVAAFWRFLNGKDDFALGHVLGPWLLIRCGQTEIRTLGTHGKGEDPDVKPTSGAPAAMWIRETK
jgi:hypothetical protein